MDLQLREVAKQCQNEERPAPTFSWVTSQLCTLLPINTYMRTSKYCIVIVKQPLILWHFKALSGNN